MYVFIRKSEKNPYIDNLQYIIVDTKKKNIIHVIFLPTHIKVFHYKVCVHVRNTWYITEGLSPSEGGSVYIYTHKL